MIRKNILELYTKFLFPKCTNLYKSIMQRLYNMSIEQTLSKPKTNSTETRF